MLSIAAGTSVSAFVNAIQNSRAGAGETVPRERIPPDPDSKAQQEQKALEDQRRIAELSARDREVRTHEQAHAAAGGRYAGAPSYQYERGPDGVNYAVGGEVPIDTGRAATPQETLIKAQIIRRAALAPAEPSSQDRRIAAEASQLESRARAEIAAEQAAATQQKTIQRSPDLADDQPADDKHRSSIPDISQTGGGGSEGGGERQSRVGIFDAIAQTGKPSQIGAIFSRLV